MFFEQFTHNRKEGDRPIVPRVGRVTRFRYWDNEEDFQLSGQVPVESDMLKIAVIIGVIEDTVSACKLISCQGPLSKLDGRFFPQNTRCFQDMDKVVSVEYQLL